MSRSRIFFHNAFSSLQMSFGIFLWARSPAEGKDTQVNNGAEYVDAVDVTSKHFVEFQALQEPVREHTVSILPNVEGKFQKFLYKTAS